MRIFVAGRTGAVGRAMMPQLAAAGHTIVAISRQPEKVEQLRKAGADAMVGDVFDRDRLISLVRDARPDALIHQLTELPAAMNPRRLSAIYERNNGVGREGTRNLIAAAGAANVERIG